MLTVAAFSRQPKPSWECPARVEARIRPSCSWSAYARGEPLRWTYLAAMLCLVAAVVFIFLPVD